MAFISGLKAGAGKLVIEKGTRVDIDCVIRGVEKAAAGCWDEDHKCYFSELQVSEIRRRHIKHILDYCSKHNGRWSAYRHNRYLDQLSMIFRILLEYEAIENNPCHDIRRLEHTPAKRELLTLEERQKIDGLRDQHYEFWRYIMIFYRSGCRTTELLALRKDDGIDLSRQEFQITVKKGSRAKKDIRVIHDDVFPLWKEIIDQAGPGQFLFSKYLKPGDLMIHKDQICRRWAKYVKASVKDGGLNIKKDFYSLKHLNVDNIAAETDIFHAQLAVGHTTPVITLNNYAVGERQRRLDKLKKAGEAFI
jgi:integrase